MGISFNRAVELVVTGTDGIEETFLYPEPGLGGRPNSLLGGIGLDISFTVNKSWQSTPNTGQVTLINLNAPARQRLLSPRSTITLAAGYRGLSGDGESNVQQIFKGQITHCDDSMAGVTRRTTIQAQTLSGGMPTVESFRKDFKVADAMKKLLEGLQGVDVTEAVRGLGDIVFREGADKFHKGAAFSGNSWQILQEMTGFTNANLSVQDGKVILDYPDRQTPINYLTPETGLIGTPTFNTNTFGTSVAQDGTETGALALIKFRSLLIPALQPNELVKVEWNGTLNAVIAKVRDLSHTGNTQGGPWYTDVEATITELEAYEANDAVNVLEGVA